MKIENTKVWQTLTETQRAFWLAKKCRTCFYFRARFKTGETHCNNIARRKEISGYTSDYTYVKADDESCKRYRNDIMESERRAKSKNPFKRKK